MEKNYHFQSVFWNWKRYIYYSSKGATFAENLNRTIKNLFRVPVFEKCNANCEAKTTSLTKEYKKTNRSLTKITKFQSTSKKIVENVYKSFLHKANKMRPMCKMGHLFRTANKKTFFPKGDTENWRSNFYTKLREKNLLHNQFITKTNYPRKIFKRC